jgi:hypothetical protein
MASEIPYEGVMKAFRALRKTEGAVKSLDTRVTKIEKEGGGGGTEDAKARKALEDVAALITTTEGSGTGGKWTLADCSQVLRSIATTITEALACVAVALCVGCASNPPLKAVGPHGYTHFEDMDPDAEVLTYDEVTNLVHRIVATKRFDIDSFGNITAGGVGLPEYIANTVTNLSGNTMVMTVPDGEGGYKHEFYLLDSEDFAPYAAPAIEPLGKRNEGESEAPAGSGPRANLATSEPKPQTPTKGTH